MVVIVGLGYIITIGNDLITYTFYIKLLWTLIILHGGLIAVVVCESE